MKYFTSNIEYIKCNWQIEEKNIDLFFLILPFNNNQRTIRKTNKYPLRILLKRY